MRIRAEALAAILITALLTTWGCKKKGETDPATQPTSEYGNTPYGTAYPQQTTYPQETYPTSTGTATASTGSGATASTLSTPSDLATPCQDDTPCLTHRCNTAHGRCAFPCQTNDDCLPGNQCMTPVCVPAVSSP